MWILTGVGELVIPLEPIEDPLAVVVTEMCDPDDGSDMESENAESISYPSCPYSWCAS